MNFICTMIFDAHNHIGGPDIGDGRSQSAAGLVEKMDGAGVDKAVIFPFNTPGPDGSFAEANDVIAEAVRGYPGRLIGFGRVDPRTGDQALREVVRLVTRLGLRGLKLHPKAQNFRLDSPGLMDVMGAAAEYGVPVVFDSGTSACPWPDVVRLASAFPAVPTVMAHLRGRGWEEAIACPNVYFGTTAISRLGRIYDAVQLAGAGRIISGSDSPYLTPESEIRKIDALPIGVKQKERIKGINMMEILRIAG